MLTITGLPTFTVTYIKNNLSYPGKALLIALEYSAPGSSGIHGWKIRGGQANKAAGLAAETGGVAALFASTDDDDGGIFFGSSSPDRASLSVFSATVLTIWSPTARSFSTFLRPTKISRAATREHIQRYREALKRHPCFEGSFRTSHVHQSTWRTRGRGANRPMGRDDRAPLSQIEPRVAHPCHKWPLL